MTPHHQARKKMRMKVTVTALTLFEGQMTVNPMEGSHRQIEMEMEMGKGRGTKISWVIFYYLVLICLDLPCFTCLFISSLVSSRLVLSCLFFFLVLSLPFSSFPVLSCPVWSGLVLSCLAFYEIVFF